MTLHLLNNTPTQFINATIPKCRHKFIQNNPEILRRDHTHIFLFAEMNKKKVKFCKNIFHTRTHSQTHRRTLLLINGSPGDVSENPVT